MSEPVTITEATEGELRTRGDAGEIDALGRRLESGDIDRVRYFCLLAIGWASREFQLDLRNPRAYGAGGDAARARLLDSDRAGSWVNLHEIRASLELEGEDAGPAGKLVAETLDTYSLWSPPEFVQADRRYREEMLRRIFERRIATKEKPADVEAGPIDG